MSAEKPHLAEEQCPNWAHLDALDLTPARRSIIESFKTHPWFQATAPELQVTLATLPQEGKENHDGFLRDMAKRPEALGGVIVEKLIDLPHGNFALIPIFQVRNESTGVQYPYEYVSWRHGPESGAKGIVYVRGEDGNPSHFIVLRGDKFAPGKREWDTIGGFIDINVDGVTTVMQRVYKEIREELGVEDLKIDNVRDLGTYLPDAGMTNNRPSVFAAFIDLDQAQKVEAEPINPDIYELKSGALVFPMSQLPEIIMNNSDGFFHTTITRSVSSGLLDPQFLVGANPNNDSISAPVVQQI